MPNAQYRKGADAERELMRNAESSGASVYRGAGSHGAYDVAVSMPNGVRYLVNIKCNNWAGPDDRLRLALLGNLVDVPLLAMKLDRKGWRYRMVEDDGTMGPISEIAPWQ
jgi:Holliday junction resolvase